MRTNVIFGVASIAALVGTVAAAPVGGGAGDAIIDDLQANTATRQLQHFNEPTEGGMLGLPSVRAQSGPIGLAGNVLNFGINGTATASSGSGNSTSGNADAFYLGTAAGLNAAQGGVWFNTITGGLTTVGPDTLVLGFGNNPNAGGDFSANRVVFNFAPGVQGFAFNFADIGDVSDAELVVRWSDGTESGNMLAGRIDEETGFFSLLAAAGKTIDRMIFRQTSPGNQDFNDGFLLYGFTTLTVVPLPPAAWAGLAMLGGVAGVRKLRRR